MGSKKDILKVKNYIKEVLKYTFSNDSLMINSITHKSIGYQNYERLEFLGDAVLQLAITEILVKKYTEIAEGALSRERQSLVNRKILSNRPNSPYPNETSDLEGKYLDIGFLYEDFKVKPSNTIFMG